MPTFTGSSLAATVAATSSTITGYTTQTWVVECATDILCSSYVVDVLNAGTYTLTVDGSAWATVVTTTSPQAAVTFTPSSPVQLARGSHTFVLSKTGAAVFFYSNNSQPSSLATGTGADLVAWQWWLEVGAASTVPGTLNFKVADGTLVAKVDRTAVSSGNFAAQTWTVTFTDPVWVYGAIKGLRDADASVGYDLKVGGVTKANVLRSATPGTNLVDHLWLPSTPIKLAAGAHTFAFVPSANRRWTYTAGTGTADSGSGSAYVSGWSVWAESTGNQVPARLIFTLAPPPNVPTSLAADPASDSIDFTWAVPASDSEHTDATGYEVRIDGGTPVDKGNTFAHTFTGLTPETSYDLEVRAYSTTGGPGAWALISSSTVEAPPEPDYIITLRIGSHEWDIEAGDPIDPELPQVLQGVTFEWSAPDDKGWPPAPWNMPLDTIQLRVWSPTADAVADIKRYDVVRFKFVPAGVDGDALIDFAGMVNTEPRITRAQVGSGGVWLDVAAVDYRLLLQLITIFGLDPDDGGDHNGEGTLGEWRVAEPDALPVDLVRGVASLDVLEGGSVAPYGGLDEWVEDALNLGYGEPWLTSDSGPVWDTMTDHSSDSEYQLPGVQNLHKHYEYGTDLVTLHDVYKLVGAYPMPYYYHLTSQEGDIVQDGPFRYVDVDISGATDNVLAVLNAIHVLGDVEWRRGFVPNVVDRKIGASAAFERHWMGEFAGESEPVNPETVQRISYADQRVNDFNLVGFMEEVPTADWSLYKAEIRGDLDPDAVRTFFIYPQRVLTAVRIDNLEADRDPNGTGSLLGRLSRAAFRLDSMGRWGITVRIRPALNGDYLLTLEE